ncbi:MAG: hypothetical protein ACI865_002995 [Flavobacteriaceae bacterium]|jgi:hypothetical protein
MKALLFLCTILITSVGFSQEEADEKQVKISGSYGFKEKDPIKVGGGDMPTATLDYIKKLKGPNGGAMYYEKLGKGKSYENPDPALTRKEKGILYMYELREDGEKKTYIVYFDQYRFEEPTPLKGFTWK